MHWSEPIDHVVRVAGVLAHRSSGPRSPGNRLSATMVPIRVQDGTMEQRVGQMFGRVWDLGEFATTLLSDPVQVGQSPVAN